MSDPSVRMTQLESEVRDNSLGLARLESRIDGGLSKLEQNIEQATQAYQAGDNNVMQHLTFVKESFQNAVKDLRALTGEVKELADELTQIRAAHARSSALTAFAGVIVGGIVVALVTVLVVGGGAVG